MEKGTRNAELTAEEFVWHKRRRLELALPLAVLLKADRDQLIQATHLLFGEPV